ncbi:vitamin D3 receptor-like [Ornithodoros turicata]|uniref:vitamin D3 receptor-like n=1 Tax=Ornithodoros turicata TaxID=34597 RepID=UPI0031388436
MNTPSNGSSGTPVEDPGGPSWAGRSPTSGRPIKVCGVCGDRAKSYHFGGISCDSCKAFFRRSVQNGARFQCPYEGCCRITVASRKCCQSCRFKKCLSIGMEQSWVMTEQERLQLLRQRLEKRQRRHATLTGAPAADPSCVSQYLTEDDIKSLEDLVNARTESISDPSFDDRLRLPGERSRTDVLNIFFTAIQQFSGFAQRLEAFCRLAHDDQEVLLRCGVLELCFLRSVMTFDHTRDVWTDVDGTPLLATSDVERLVSSALFEKQKRFISAFKDLDPDDPTMALLLAVVLLSPDRPGLQDTASVSKEQDYYSVLLRKYLSWRRGTESSGVHYARLLMTLPDLRELADGHTEFDLQLAREEAREVQERLTYLRLEGGMRSKQAASARPGFRRWVFWKDVLRDSDSPFSQIEEESTTSSEGSERFSAPS